MGFSVTRSPVEPQAFCVPEAPGWHPRRSEALPSFMPSGPRSLRPPLTHGGSSPPARLCSPAPDRSSHGSARPRSRPDGSRPFLPPQRAAERTSLRGAAAAPRTPSPGRALGRWVLFASCRRHVPLQTPALPTPLPLSYGLNRVPPDPGAEALPPEGLYLAMGPFRGLSAVARWGR